MKRVLILTLVIGLAGCSTLKETVRDTNESTKSNVGTAVKDESNVGTAAVRNADDKMKTRIEGGLITEPLDDPFKLKIGQTANIKSEDLEIRFKDVIEDSRCSGNVQCAQAGQVIVKINVKKGGEDLGDSTLILKYGDNKLNTALIHQYDIKLTKISPNNLNSTNKPAPSDYIATFTVTN
jgi:hypothetical protein